MSTSGSSTTKTPVYLLYAALLALGPALGGYFIGKAIEITKNFDRKIAVKGLSERQIEADQATLSLKTSYNGDDVQKIYDQITKDNNIIVKYLNDHGFKKDDIQFDPPQITDRAGDRWGEVKEGQTRFIVESKITAQANNINLVSIAHKNIGQLIEKSILVTATPIYVISNQKFNELKPDMIAEATKSARETANQFAKDSNTKVGGIITAHQGTFSIERATKNDSYDHFSSPQKLVRVVTNVSFSLNA